MRLFILIPLMLFLLPNGMAAQQKADAMPYAAPAGQQIWFQKDVQQLQKLDRAQPPPEGAILLTGSSILRFWTGIEHDMAPLPIVNRAFGGARTWEVLHYLDRIVLPYRPRIILYYCGSNDIEFGEPAEAIAGRFQTFTGQVHAALPRTRIFFVSINMAPQKRTSRDTIRAANSLVQALCAASGLLDFIDVNSALLDNRQQPRRELFQEDGLHLRPPAYVEFKKIIKPLLKQAWEEMLTQEP